MVSDWIKATRQQRGWSQAELARRADLTQLAIHFLEDHPYAMPGAPTLAKLAHAFNVSVEALVQDAARRGPGASDDLARTGLDDWMRAILALGVDLSPAERQEVLAHARSLRSPSSPRMNRGLAENEW